MSMEFMYITNDPSIAQIAEKAGVERIWIDLEKNGKEERQPGNTVKSNHCLSDIKKVASVLKKSKLQVRINPIYKDSENEINIAIENGAQILMLPYFKTVEEVKRFLEIVSGRVVTNLLVETKEAYEQLDDILALEDIDEIHVGLNDLHMSFGKKFMFEMLSDGTVEKICNIARKKRISYGFGGIAKIGEGTLPSEIILGEHYRLLSRRVILSRSFSNVELYQNNPKLYEKEFIENINKIREYEKFLTCQSEQFFLDNKQKMENIVRKIVEDIGG